MSMSSKNNPSKKAECHLPTCFTLVSCSAYSFTLKMEETLLSETSVDHGAVSQ
jgi:hypothetical protein